VIKRVKLRPTDEYHEDMGSCLFVSFSRESDGAILGEPPEIAFKEGYLEIDFDPEEWTHFIDGDFNFIFTDADPDKFPKIEPKESSYSLNDLRAKMDD